MLFNHSDKLSNGLQLHVGLQAALPSEGESPHLDIIISGQALPELAVLRWGLVAKHTFSGLPRDRTLPHQVRAFRQPST